MDRPPIDPGHGYRETPAPPALHQVAECGWRHDGGIGAKTVLPDGCVDILIDLDTARARVVGTMTRALRLAGAVRPTVAIRLQPGAAGRLFPVAVHECTDAVIDLAELWDDADTVVERVLRLPRERQVSGLLEAVAARRPAPPDPRIRAAVAWLRRRAGGVGELAGELGISRQFLARQFRRHVGVSPKALGRVFRMQKLIARVGAQPGLPWSLAALDAGYYDQSHMIGEFKELTGATPRDWFRSR